MITCVVGYVIDATKVAAFESRVLLGADPDFVAADRIRDESGRVLRYERTFMRPLLPEPGPRSSDS